MDVLDRILDGDDLAAVRVVDQVEHRGQGGTLAAAGGPGEQGQPALGQGDVADDRGELELLDRADLQLDDAEDHRGGPRLAVHVTAEPGHARDRVGEVEARDHGDA